jgi:sugar phosphate isomerase/epimerase
MMNPVTRRSFLKLSAAAGLATAAIPLLPAAGVSTANPFQRSGKPRLKLSLAAYSFRERFPLMRGKKNAKLAPEKATDMIKFIDYCAAQGIDGAELTSYFFDAETDDYILKLKRHAYLRGVAISGTAIGNNFSLPKGPRLDEEIAATKKWIDRAALLGAPHIRVFAGNIPRDVKDLTREQADKIVVESLKVCGDYAAKKGVFLGLENHDSIGSADTLIPMMKAVDNPWVGINLDSGNFRTADPYKDFAACVPYALNVQLKVELAAEKPGAKKQHADLKRFVQILRDGGYQGWLVLEYEAPEDPSVAVPRVLNELKTLVA